MPDKQPEAFRWSELLPAKDYRRYIANLRAIGCPEATIEDIVRGDTGRAFAWERNQLGLDGSGAGPWSRAQERQLVASLLELPAADNAVMVESSGNRPSGNASSNEFAENTAAQGVANLAPKSGSSGIDENSVPAQTATAAPSYPLFLQNVNWNALGFTADQQAAIAQVRQQFENQMGSLSQDSSSAASQGPADPKTLSRWQKALQIADNQLPDLLGAQAYQAYELQQYYLWYQPQVEAAQAQGEPLHINPDAFSLK